MIIIIIGGIAFLLFVLIAWIEHKGEKSKRMDEIRRKINRL